MIEVAGVPVGAGGAEAARTDPAAVRELLYGVEDTGARRVVVSTRDVRRVFVRGAEETVALGGVTLDIYAGEYLSIMGPSGSGKTTLFNMIGGLDKPSSGKVFIDEVDIAQLDAYELAWLRCRKIGYIFQTFNLVTVMTCLENVMLPMVFAGLTTDEAMDKAAGLLKQVGLGDRLKHKPAQLSGGMQKRASLARSIITDPQIILYDEPTTGLDPIMVNVINRLINDLKEKMQAASIIVTHDVESVEKVADRIAVLYEGKIIEIGEVKEVMGSNNPIVRQFMEGRIEGPIRV